ncbi:zinc finger protein 501-like [Syngnathus typhle]|uniref:zinc finger protein 501-like n=1 Tax=Syngnathus typhle TaxID=161592 RepID=UPI002A6A46AB|nr:zinc finger protein 501-like [Syngnathus typhle]XP_061142057.1 zinc finger protein 501-like [Syngnathus typhle]
MFARTTAEYMEEKDHSRRRLIDLWLQPYVVLRRADISEVICPKHQEPERPRIDEEDVGKEVHHVNEQMEQKFRCAIKEEDDPEWPCNKEEGEDFYDIRMEEEEDACKMPLTVVPLKSLDEGQHEVSKRAELPSCSSSQQMTREGDEDHCGGSQAGPPSDSDNVSSHVPAPADDESQNKHRQCSQCGKYCADNSGLKQHMRIHARKKNHSCSDCGRKFSRREDLKRHTRIHTFSYSVCSQKFSDKGSLTIITRIYTGEKPFSCSVCGHKFSRSDNLKEHTRIHTGEKPFSCSVCGQRFSHNGNLKEHTRIHTGEKPFSCSDCGKKFSQREYLKCHTRIHTGEKPFSCSVCGRKFSRRQNLKKHTRIHTGEKPFSCSVCAKGFLTKTSLKSHTTRIHTGENQGRF